MGSVREAFYRVIDSFETDSKQDSSSETKTKEIIKPISIIIDSGIEE